MTETRTLSARTCLGCGLLCDDITLTIGGGVVAGASNACESGITWFGSGVAPARIQARGADATLDAALDEAARLLSGARAPHVVIAADAACESVAAAVTCADWIGARVDLWGPHAEDMALLAIQERGIATATLGDVRNRADLVVFWATDPSSRLPRLSSRIITPTTADGTARVRLAIDVATARGPLDVDHRESLDADDELDALAVLADLVARGPDAPTAASPNVQRLRTHLERARYVVVVAGLEPDAPPARFRRLLDLSRQLNHHRRGALCVLRSGGNRVGAEAVLTRHTGYPMAVDFATGVPRYRPCTDAGTRDVVLIVGRAASLSPARLASCAAVPTIVIGPDASDGPLRSAAVTIDTGTPGIHSPGTALRLDDVPLRLEPAVHAGLDAGVVCRLLGQRLEDVHR
jgi:formylmethanofuran dehydrogenase subunit B